MKNSKKFSILALVLALMLTITACGGVGSKDSTGSGSSTEEVKILKANNSSEPGSLDPALATGSNDSWVLDHTFEGLMKYDKDGKLVPGMAAEDPTISDDGLTYTFKLKEGLKWSNGEPLTAHDFEFTYKRLADPETAADYSYQMEYIKGGKEFTEGKASKDDMAVKAIDDLTLEIQLDYVSPFFSGLTAFYALYPVSEKVVTENPNWAKDASTHVSNGPFKLVAWEHESKIQVVKNENYYDAENIKLDGIDFDIIVDKNTEWTKYESGELDVVVKPQNEIVQKLISDDDKELVTNDYMSVELYNFNMDTKPFNNVKVRKAFSMSIDRKVIVENVRGMGDTIAEGVVPFGVKDKDGKDFRELYGNLIKEDSKEAKKLFEEGLREEGITLEEFNSKNFVLLYNTNDTHKKVTQALQEMWKTNLGAEIQIENTDFQVKMDREKSGDFQISRDGWVGDYEDAMTMLDPWETDAPNNDPNYSNPEYDKLITGAKEAENADKRFVDMQEAEKILMEDCPVMPLYFGTMQYAIKPHIKGVYSNIIQYPVLTYAEIN